LAGDCKEYFAPVELEGDGVYGATNRLLCWSNAVEYILTRYQIGELAGGLPYCCSEPAISFPLAL